MSWKNINFEDKNIKKKWFLQKQKIFKIDEIYVDKILLSKAEPYDTDKWITYFIGCNDDDIIIPIWIKRPQMIGYVKCFNINKIMFFKVTDKKLLKIILKYGKK